MTQWHEKSKRKKTGGLRTSKRRSDRILAWRGGDSALTIVEKKDKRKRKRTLGGNSKIKQKTARTASISIPGEKKAVKAEIVAVKENKANRLYTRKNIITKGALITVKIGDKEQIAKVTSRPGQSGVVQAVLEK